MKPHPIGCHCGSCSGALPRNMVVEEFSDLELSDAALEWIRTHRADLEVVDMYRNVHGERVTVSQSGDGRATLLQVWPRDSVDKESTPAPPQSHWLYRMLAAARRHGVVTIERLPASVDNEREH